MNSWHKLIGTINDINATVMSKKVGNIVYEVGKIEPNVIRAALEEYLRCSQRVHTIAFLQWRIMYPSHIQFHEEMLVELIEERMKFMYGNMYMGIRDKKKMPGKQYGLDQQFYDNFAEAISKAQPYNIWSFEQIGLFDPYPLEPMETKFHIPETDEDLVYQQERFVYNNSPNTLYFPSKMLLFKIMRACIGITDPKDLWFN